MADQLMRAVRSAVGPDGGPSDAELLRRFATTRDAGAFELLVWRHAGMAKAAAAAVIRDRHLAEDAAQAAFLALARKAGSVRDSPAGWLYRVSRRVAVRMRRAAGVSRTGPGADRHASSGGWDGTGWQPAPGPDRLTPAARLDTADVAALHDEIARLPDRYRLPVLLCYLEGLSHADAAARLGWPVGTVAGRLSRAKDALRPRLVRRGLAPALAALAVAGDGAFAAATTRAAVAFAAGELAGLSPTVLPLAHGVLRTMTLFKLKLAAGVLLACGTLTLGGVWAGGQQPGVGPPPQPAAPRPKPAERRKVDPAAPNPGKPEDPDRVADVAARTADLRTLKQLAVAFHNYESAYGCFPRDIAGPDGKPLLSWRVALLPFIEQEALYRKFKLDEPWDSPNNLPWSKVAVAQYQLHFQKGSADTYFQAFAGQGTLFDPAVPKMTLPRVTDGLSRTLMVMPVGPAVPWSKPGDVAYHPGKPFPKIVWPYANTLLAANGDGSCFHLDPKMTEAQLRQYIEIADGLAWPGDSFEKLRLEFPADGPAERAESRKHVAAAADQLAELHKLMVEYLALVDAGAAPPPPDAAEGLARSLKAQADELRAKLAELKKAKKD